MEVDVDWVAAHLDDPTVRVIEFDVSRAAYDAGHIPGATLLNAYADLRDARYQAVGLDELGAALARAGVGPATTVVCYGYAAPLGFWLLKAHGHADVRILAGVRDRWAESGREWSTATPGPSDDAHPALVVDDRLVATRADVESALGDSTQVVLDVRSVAEYSGEQFWPSGATDDAGRAGHVPGAVSVPIDRLRAADQTLRSADDLQRAFDEAGVTRDKSVIVYCTIGNRAGQAWYALTQVLGFPDVRVYYGSWVEWGNAADTPVESG